MGFVYQLEHKPTGRLYVGCSEKDDATVVVKGITRNLNRGTDWCKDLQDAWLSDGPMAFSLTVLRRFEAKDELYRGKRDIWDKLSEDHEMLNTRPSLRRILPKLPETAFPAVVDNTDGTPEQVPTMTEAERRMEILRLMDPYKTRFVEGDNGVPIMVYDGEMPTLSTPEPVAHGSLETEDDEDYEYDENTGERVYSSKR